MVPVVEAFGMDVVAGSENLTDERCAELGVTKVTKDELVSNADVLESSWCSRSALATPCAPLTSPE